MAEMVTVKELLMASIQCKNGVKQVTNDGVNFKADIVMYNPVPKVLF